MPGMVQWTARRLRLAAELRRQRKKTPLTLEQAGHHLGLNQSTVSRIETAKADIKPAYVESLMLLYDAPKEERDALVQLARDSRKRGWWQEYRDVLTSEYQDFIGFESEAFTVDDYEPDMVPGLLQTEEYARSALRAQIPDATDDDVERRVKVRMERQTRLRGDDPVKLWAVIGEGALRYLVGGSDVMRGQLEHLADISSPSNVNVRLQVLPFAGGAHPGMVGAFIILGYDGLDIVYLEHLTTSQYLDKEEQIKPYRVIFEHLKATALSRTASRKLIVEALKAL